MPGKNLIRYGSPDFYYHVYNRGVNKQPVFLEDEDYAVFLNLLKRYFGKKPQQDNKGRLYPNFYDQAELLCFCLMKNHYHLLVYQHQQGSLSSLLKAVGTAFGMYFNKKYKRVGPVFQNKFRASAINNDSYLEHISRYIHLNPDQYLQWQWSSLPFYLGSKKADWIKPSRIMAEYTPKTYLDFLADYTEQRDAINEIKSLLADH